MKFNFRAFLKYFFILICLVYFSLSVSPLIRTTISNLNDLNFYEGDLHRIKDHFGSVIVAGQARGLVPSDAVVDVTPMDWSIDRVGLRYELYPIKLGKNWQYFIDYKKEIENVSAKWDKRLLFDEIPIYANEGYHFRANPSREKAFPYLSLILVHFSVVFWKLLAGFLILRLARFEFLTSGQFWLWGTAYLLGTLFLGAVAWIFLLFGFPLLSFSLLVFWGGSILALYFAGRPKQVRPGFLLPVSREPDFFAVCIKAVAVLFIVFNLFCCYVQPVMQFDPMSHWLMKAKVLFYERSLEFGYTHHNYYPILWPLDVAAQFCLIGEPCDEIAKWTVGIIFIAFISQFYGGLRVLGLKFRTRWIVMLAYLSSFLVFCPMIFASAESLFTAYLTAVIVFVLCWLKSGENRYVILALLMDAGLCLVKLEGVVASAMIGLSVFCAAGWRRVSWKQIRIPVLFFLIPVLNVLWILWIKTHGDYERIYHFQQELNFVKFWAVWELFVKTMISKQYGEVLFFGLIAYVLFRKRRPLTGEEKFLFFLSVFLVFFSFASMTGWTPVEIEQDFSTTFPRLFLHATPAIMLLWSSKTFSRKDLETGT